MIWDHLVPYSTKTAKILQSWYSYEHVRGNCIGIMIKLNAPKSILFQEKMP